MGFFSKIPSVTAPQAAEHTKRDGTVLIDVRSEVEFASGHAKSAINCPLPSLRNCVERLRSFVSVYVICQSGGRSSTATSMLISEKINATNVAGGTSAWRAHGLPIHN
ncbi:MAG TPA: rhodanese-like domain-containing protein [Candidatus Paceibacterota bacterium]